MFKANGNFSLLKGSFVFAEAANRVAAFKSKNPDAEVIRMGIGDVTQPIVPAVVAAMHKAVDELGCESSFRGYAPNVGYPFLREAIAKNDYQAKGLNIQFDEVFISDGGKTDCAAIPLLFGKDTKVAVTDPVYPAYVDDNVMQGRSGKYDAAKGGYENIVYMPCTSENNFIPDLPATPVDVMYLCYPNNPSGTTLTRDQVKVFVDYALKTGTLILYDCAYEAYIREDDVPHSIYEIPGAEACAIEMRSLSKTAGFTGVRCAYTVIPHALKYMDDMGNVVELNKLWTRRCSSMFNGVSYVTQRGAEAIFSDEGKVQIKSVIDYYMENARIMTTSLKDAGYEVYGGKSAPYIWLKCGKDSWEFFDELLEQKQIVGTPGVGFGSAGEGYFRMTAFASRENTIRAMERVCKG